MDRASAIRALRPIGRIGFSNNRPRVTRRGRIANSCACLAGERRHDRERPADRDRSALRIAFWTGRHLLVELVAAEKIRLAYLDGSLDFSRPRYSGQRPGPPAVFLRAGDRRSVLRKEAPPAHRRQTFRGWTDYDRHLRRVGVSVLAGDDGHDRWTELGRAIDRPFYRRRFQTS